MRYELKRIEIWPVFKIVFILSLLLGFFIGLLYGGLFLLMDAFSQFAVDSGFEAIDTFGPGFVIAIIVGCTLGLSFIYTISAVVFTVLYNLLAGSLGGLRFQLESVEKTKKDVHSVG